MLLSKTSLKQKMSAHQDLQLLYQNPGWKPVQPRRLAAGGKLHHLQQEKLQGENLPVDTKVADHPKVRGRPLIHPLAGSLSFPQGSKNCNMTRGDLTIEGSANVQDQQMAPIIDQIELTFAKKVWTIKEVPANRPLGKRPALPVIEGERK
jgi:hypothetical protein